MTGNETIKRKIEENFNLIVALSLENEGLQAVLHNQKGENKMECQTENKIFAKALSVAEINQLQESYEKVVEQNKNIQRELNLKKQELNEISAGVLMIAEVLGIDIPKKATATELIPEIAATIENENSKEENL